MPTLRTADDFYTAGCFFAVVSVLLLIEVVRLLWKERTRRRAIVKRLKEL